MANTTIVNDRLAAGTFVQASGSPMLKLFNNIFFGKGTVVNMTAEQRNNLVGTDPNWWTAILLTATYGSAHQTSLAEPIPAPPMGST